MKLSKIKSNPNNPRLIKDDKFKKLVQSISEFPEMMEKRPIVCVTDVDGSIYPLGGNMRLKALQELKYKDIPDSWVLMADELTEEKRREFVIKDNVGFGEWDYDDLANNWDAEQLTDWGLDIPDFNKIDNLEEGEEILIEQSLQILPKNDYIIIYENSESEEWDELKKLFKCKTVRQGGCKIGSTSDKATTGLERVFNLKTLKERLGI
jgi:ParB-like chromosome segregation protein Spo0J